MITLAGLRGHWRRDWIRGPDLDDSTTRVHWLQAEVHFADIRVPLNRPGLEGARCLADLAPADLAVLLSAEGFAGQISLQGDICTWHRALNWRGFPCPVDAGKLWVDDAGHLIEDGVHADYREQWQQVPAGRLVARELGGDSLSGLLIADTDSFVLALGQPGTAARPELAKTLQSGAARAADAAPAFEPVYILGQFDGGRGTATLSTQPFCEGRQVLDIGSDAATLTLPGFDGSPRRLELSLLTLAAI